MKLNITWFISLFRRKKKQTENWCCQGIKVSKTTNTQSANLYEVKPYNNPLNK